MKGWFVLKVIGGDEETGGSRRMRWAERGRLRWRDEVVAEAEEIGGGGRWMGWVMKGGEMGIYL